MTLSLQDARKLVARNYAFTEPKDSRQFLESFRVRGNILSAFLEECCNLAPDTATILMVDSNIQRENILPSESAGVQDEVVDTKHNAVKCTATQFAKCGK